MPSSGKSGFAVATLHARNQLDEWRNRYHSFLERLTRTSFSGVILDYDGTLCGSTERFTGLRKEVFLALVSLLRAGILLGIATGRGKSVRKELQVAHLFGSSAEASSDWLPQCRRNWCAGRQRCTSGCIRRYTIVSCRSMTLLTATALSCGTPHGMPKGVRLPWKRHAQPVCTDLWSCVSGIVRSHGGVGVTAVQSSHSIDILAPGVSKQSLITALMERLPQSHEHSAILCIGDRGRWPGNDFELLQHPLSLSVDQTSSDPDTCWNLAPPSSRYVDACLYYLRQMKVHVGGFRLSRLADRRRPQ